MNPMKTVTINGQGYEIVDAQARSDINSIDVPTNAEILNLVYPVGTVYASSTNTNPGTKLGGTWALQGKGFAEKRYDSGIFTPNSTNVSSATQVARTSGQEAWARLNIVTAVALADATIELGTFDLEAMGMETVQFTHYITAMSDGRNGVAQVSVSGTTGIVNSNDVVTKTSGGTIAAGSSIMLEVYWTCIPSDSMIDSFCDKFYWKRTA